MKDKRNTKEKIIDILENKEREIVINNCWGGFGISNEALFKLIKKNSKIIEKFTIKVYYGEEWKREFPKVELTEFNGGFFKHKLYEGWLTDKEFIYSIKSSDEIRDDVELVKVVKKLKGKANGSHSKLEIKKIPLDVEWEINDYDGMETISEVHRKW